MVSSLGTLEAELLALILEYVDDVSPNTTKNLFLVNKHLYSTSKLVSHRRKKVLYGYARGQPTTTDLKAWQEDEELLRGVRYLEIRLDEGRQRVEVQDRDRERLQDAKYRDLAAFISKLGNLKSLDWYHVDPIPLKIIDALHEHHKKATLKIHNWTRWDKTHDHTDPAEIALSRSPALTSIRAFVWDYDTHPDLREIAFRRIVANAPNLVHASISTGQSGCFISFPSHEERQEVEDMSKLFYTHGQPNSALRSLTLDGYGLAEHTLRSWSTIVDLGQLTRFQCFRGLPKLSYFTYAPIVLHSLKEVSLNLKHHHASFKEAAEHYITTCCPLESLSLWSWRGIISLSTILDAHGPTLRSLQLHERETSASHGQEMRTLLTADELKQIATACPVLTDFTFDRDRHTVDMEKEVEHDADIFGTLAKMKLDRLQIYYDLGIASLVNHGISAASPTASLHPDSHDDAEEEEEEEEEDGGSTNGGEYDDGDHETDASPRHKRAKVEKVKKQKEPQYLRPSPDTAIIALGEKLWKKIFLDVSAGPRALDLKFGEYERKFGVGFPSPWVLCEQGRTSYWKVRPKERDDQAMECDVVKHKKEDEGT